MFHLINLQNSGIDEGQELNISIQKPTEDRTWYNEFGLKQPLSSFTTEIFWKFEESFITFEATHSKCRHDKKMHWRTTLDMLPLDAQIVNQIDKIRIDPNFFIKNYIKNRKTSDKATVCLYFEYFLPFK